MNTDVELLEKFFVPVAAVLIGTLTLTGVAKHSLKKLASRTPSKLDDTLVPILMKWLRSLAVLSAGLILAHLLGVSLGPVWGIASGLTLGLALALKDSVLGDAAGLLTLVLGRKFDLDDVIQVGKEKGRVIGVNLSGVVLETASEEHVYIPLKKVNSSVVIKEIT